MTDPREGLPNMRTVVHGWLQSEPAFFPHPTQPDRGRGGGGSCAPNPFTRFVGKCRVGDRLTGRVGNAGPP
jgi:hypothetical protein